MIRAAEFVDERLISEQFYGCVMKASRVFLAIMLIALAMSMASAAPKNPKPGSEVPVPQIGYTIDTPIVHLRDVHAGNSNPVTAEIYVRKAGMSIPICGLELINFKVLTVQVPSNGYPVTLNSIGKIASPCGSMLFISPSPYNWAAGNYIVKAYYVSADKELANSVISFTVT